MCAQRRAPCGIHLAHAAHSVGCTAPLFLYTCYPQEVEVMLNDDLILPSLNGLFILVHCTQDDDSITDEGRARRGFGLVTCNVRF